MDKKTHEIHENLNPTKITNQVKFNSTTARVGGKALRNIITFAVTSIITNYIPNTFVVTSNITRYIPI